MDGPNGDVAIDSPHFLCDVWEAPVPSQANIRYDDQYVPRTNPSVGRRLSSTDSFYSRSVLRLPDILFESKQYQTAYKKMGLFQVTRECIQETLFPRGTLSSSKHTTYVTYIGRYFCKIAKKKKRAIESGRRHGKTSCRDRDNKVWQVNNNQQRAFEFKCSKDWKNWHRRIKKQRRNERLWYFPCRDSFHPLLLGFCLVLVFTSPWF